MYSPLGYNAVVLQALQLIVLAVFGPADYEIVFFLLVHFLEI